MISDSERYVLALNGEIYNHKALRGGLEAQGKAFRGRSDTEVLLGLIDEVGLEHAVEECVGMFALALWDREARTFQLARDRFGEKPLYYGWHRGRFLFGSELKSITSHPAFEMSVDQEALSLLLRFGYIPSPYCIFRDTFKLLQGSILTLHVPDDDVTLTAQTCQQTVRRYWSAEEVAVRGMDAPFTGSFTEAADRLEELLGDAVQLQMQADVPLGAFLSGGIDSSVVVALMQRNSSRPVKTFSIGFDDARLNEAEDAKRVADYLGTEHSELYVSSRDALDVIPLLPTIYDEPFGDPSQIPTYLVAKLARQQVTVSLSGDGGDEIFGGYTKYRAGQRVESLPCRQAWGRLVGALPWRAIEHIGGFFRTSIAGKLRASRFDRLRALLSAEDQAAIAEQVSIVCGHPERLMKTPPRPSNGVVAPPHAALNGRYQTLAMVLDRQRYLPDDILTKVDRASMAVSLESRAPLLDHRIVDFAARLPPGFLSEGTKSKTLLRAVLYRHVPQALVDRPKAGFGIPLGSWLRDELREWARDLLSGSPDEADTFLNLEVCRAILEAHIRGERDEAMMLWPLLMFQTWRREWM